MKKDISATAGCTTSSVILQELATPGQQVDRLQKTKYPWSGKTEPSAKNPGHSRDSLPFVPHQTAFFYKGKLIAKDMGHYIAFPGGGVDPGESPKAAAKREVMEEVGAVLKGDLKPAEYFLGVEPDGPTSQRKKRYQEFQANKFTSSQAKSRSSSSQLPMKEMLGVARNS